MSAKNVITNGVLGGDATITATGGSQVRAREAPLAGERCRATTRQ